MTHVTDYLAIADTGERLRGGDSHDFEFALPASADLDQDAVLALKVNASGRFERLSSNVEINGKQVLRAIMKEESYQTLHEVVERGILVPGANKATVNVDDDERAGRGKVKFEDLVLWFKSEAAAAEPVAPALEAASAAGITIDSGNFITWQGKHANWNLWHGRGERKSRQHVDFSQSFSGVPQVVVNLVMLDIASNRNSRLRVEAENITQEGFDAVFCTWADTGVYGAGVSWVAYGLASGPLSGAQVQARLAKYTGDVVVTSESDIQVEAFHIPVQIGKLDEKSFKSALGMTSEAPEHEVFSLEDADDETGFGRIQGNSSKQLAKLMKTHLVDLKEVIVNPKQDECQYPYYLVGRASDGSLVGLKGVLVWT